jgi:hypothetical protein
MLQRCATNPRAQIRSPSQYGIWWLCCRLEFSSLKRLPHFSCPLPPPRTTHLEVAANVPPADSDAPPTVNELITTLRRSHVSPATAAAPVVTPTLPPQIRQLLSQPETPTPRPRDRRQRVDATGRRLPPGPAPPRSWIEGSRHGAKARATNKERLYPQDIDGLPGVSDGGSRKLQDMCLRTMAREWEFIREYESNNLADLPTGLRILLLSHVAVYGPEEGVGAQGLDNLLLIPVAEDGVNQSVENNEGFFRLDLSGSVGRSVSFKQLIEVSLMGEHQSFSRELTSDDSSCSSLLPKTLIENSRGRIQSSLRWVHPYLILHIYRFLIHRLRFHGPDSLRLQSTYRLSLTCLSHIGQFLP